MRRTIAICQHCAPAIQDNHLRCNPGLLRRCDFVVDPVYVDQAVEFTTVTERWEDHHGESDARQTMVLGRPLRAIAPAMHALTDFEEMVLALVHPLVPLVLLVLLMAHLAMLLWVPPSEPLVLVLARLVSPLVQGTLAQPSLLHRLHCHY